MTKVEHIRRTLFNDAIFDQLDDAQISVAWNPNVTYSGYDLKAYSFIGDTVLDMMVMHLTLYLFPSVNTAHGFTELKSRIVKNVSLTCLMEQRQLCTILNLPLDKSCADTFEAFIGITYYYLLLIKHPEPLQVIMEWMESKWKFITLLGVLVENPDWDVCDVFNH